MTTSSVAKLDLANACQFTSTCVPPMIDRLPAGVSTVTSAVVRISEVDPVPPEMNSAVGCVGQPPSVPTRTAPITLIHTGRTAPCMTDSHEPALPRRRCRRYWLCTPERRIRTSVPNPERVAPDGSTRNCSSSPHS